jgi:hypothetical protein
MSMDLYRFHIRADDAIEQDIVREHPSLADAIAEAKRTRIDIMSERLLDRLCIEIEDQSGRTVATVPTTYR